MPILSRKGLQFPVILGVTVLLSGCVSPEQLDAEIVMSGYRNNAKLEGRVVEPRTVGALAKGETLPPNHDLKMKGQEAPSLALPGMTRFTYTGDGRYEFAKKVDGELTQAAPVTGFPNTKGSSNNFLTIRRGVDGTVVISTPELPLKAPADLKDVGLEASGTISIMVDGKVLESNADEQSKGDLLIWSRTKEIMLLSPSEVDELAGDERARLKELVIRVENGPLSIDVGSNNIYIRTGDASYDFDTAYPALGSDIRSDPVTDLGVKLSPEDCISVDRHQRTNVPGLYAAGDVVIGLDQISHAMGQAGVAATAIRNDLSAVAPLIR